jgi:hypothetical protein
MARLATVRRPGQRPAAHVSAWVVVRGWLMVVGRSARTARTVRRIDRFGRRRSCCPLFPVRLNRVFRVGTVIVPRMVVLMSIRVAESWTPLSVVALVVIGIALVSLVAWLIHRS